MSSTAVGKVTWEDRSKEPPDRVGRDETRNHVAFADPVVSRSQLEIFSIMVDEEGKHPPLVFVRDRGSSNGTAVNGQLIGKGAKLSSSRPLEDGDVITIRRHAHLTLKVQLSHIQSSYSLSPTQQQEVELFKDRYVVTDRTIGEGGHAVVFLAKEVETGQHVVCKVHDISRFSQTSRAIVRIRQEAALLSTLDHPNILPVKAAFETQQTIYVITELATGGDLFSLVLRYNRLAEWAIRSIIRQVLRGVAYLHSKGVAHRDIKPENVLCGVTPQVPYRIMLADFGDSGITGPERMKSTVGTRFYRPPECAAPGHHHDLSVDIWAVGMLTLQLFLGYEELPGLNSVVFKNQEDIDIYLDLTFADSETRRRISEAGKDFIRCCLVYDGAGRPTARQAFYHTWLQEPESDRKMFKRLEAESELSWKPQRVKFPVIENLKREPPGMNKRHGSYEDDRNTPKDSVSPHFMDHKQVTAVLRPKTHSKGNTAVPGPTLPIEHNTGAQLKRKDMAPVTESAKRLKSSPP
ncbi:kinase-like domain-containing protein [Achaetomium macrosporum]|uniref:Kinase-like domain-containing protein n=1 Tax=Achaetomium macrosporum TaxID=79813 RepID=A0AAN7CJ10_9PEZI|nr:kinase-like domain-containing protein [Achaetomium macrosporum]